MTENGNGYVTDPATTGKLPAVAANAAPGKGTDALLEHLAQLVDSLPELEAKSERLAKARAAAHIDALARAKDTADAELAEADRLVSRAEEQLLRATSPLEAQEHVLAGDPVTAVPNAQGVDEAVHRAQEQVMHAGLLRGLRVGPANNAAAELADAIENSPFDSLEDALAALLAEDEIALIDQQIAEYQRDYRETLAACQSAEQTGCFPAIQ